MENSFELVQRSRINICEIPQQMENTTDKWNLVQNSTIFVYDKALGIQLSLQITIKVFNTRFSAQTVSIYVGLWSQQISFIGHIPSTCIQINPNYLTHSD